MIDYTAIFKDQDSNPCAPDNMMLFYMFEDKVTSVINIERVSHKRGDTVVFVDLDYVDMTDGIPRFRGR